MKTNLMYSEDYLLLIDEKAEIKAGDIAVHDFGMGYDLEIPCDADNLRSNTRRKVVAYYPLTSGAKELDLPLLPNPFEEVDVEKLALVAYPRDENWRVNSDNAERRLYWIEGYKAAQSKQFSLEDIKKAIEMAQEEYYNEGGYQGLEYEPEQIIQSLYTQQLPKEFIPEYENVDTYELVGMDGNYNGEKSRQLKTVANSMGKEELVGTYK